MTNLAQILKSAVTALFLAAALAGAGVAQDDALDTLFEQLADGTGDWETAESQIWAIWSRSGSDAMDLLLERGRKAISEGEIELAIEHLTALTDHAPDFAEGWNARATAYFQAGLFGPSIGDIRHTLALNPRHFGALAGLGLILEELELPKDALFAYQQALVLHPQKPSLMEHVRRLEAAVSGTNL